MIDYMTIRIDCDPCNEDITSLLADSLADIGYDSFEPDEKGLNAYVRADLYNRKTTEEALANSPIPVSTKISENLVEGKDWNEEWEKNYFKPIRIGKQCLVRSSFHPAENTEYEIVIDPKMAFGTGHHSTTSQMMKLLLDSDLEGKRIIDMGTGTGILSILAKKMGALSATGIEIDPFAADNARANCTLNNCEVTIITGDAAKLEGLDNADFFLANINRNIILADLATYIRHINPNGELLLSGFYEKDIPLVSEACQLHGLKLLEKSIDNEWAALRFKKIK